MLLRTKSSTTRLPVLRKPDTSDLQAIVSENDNKAKTVMKKYADSHRRAKPSSFEIDDKVLLKQTRTHKHSSIYDPNPFVVIKVNGSQVIIKRDNLELRRDASMLKKFIDHEFQKLEGKQLTKAPKQSNLTKFAVKINPHVAETTTPMNDPVNNDNEMLLTDVIGDHESTSSSITN